MDSANRAAPCSCSHLALTQAGGNVAPILIVDDRRDNVALFETALAPLGQPIVSAFSGKEAIAAMARQGFAVVLLDVQMPDMDGFEVAEVLQETVRENATAVIFVTALHFQREHVKRGYRLGAIDYLTKPVPIDILRAKVSVFVDLYLQRQALARALERAVDAERRLTAQAAELSRSNEELERFAYVASHDLKEPLRMETSYVQLLARRYRGRLDEKADQFIDFASEGADRMRALIDDLLLYSRIGSRARDPVRTDINHSLRRVLQDLQVAMTESSAVVTSDDLPHAVVDPRQFEQLLQNLVANAIKFRRDEAPRVHIGAVPLDGVDEGEVPGLGAPDVARGGWLFAVRDNGIGIDPRFADDVFLVFKRLHNRTEYPGTGIGLAVCRRIVERHGGRIWISSRPGEGTTFYFTLPPYAHDAARPAPRPEGSIDAQRA